MRQGPAASLQLDRRKRELRDERRCRAASASAPPRFFSDYLALVGDSADGFPGIPAGARKAGGRSPGPVYASRTHPVSHANGSARAGRRAARRRAAGESRAAMLFRRGHTPEPTCP